jgi:cell division protein FtsA
MIADDEEVVVPGVGGHAPRRVPRQFLSDVIEPRCEEIFHEVRRRLEETGLIDGVSAGAVLTGGANLMEGMVECAEEILGMPVRMGFPVGVTGLTQLVQGPQYAAGVGLLRFAARQLAEAEARGEILIESPQLPASTSGFGRGLIGWLRGAF